MAELNIKGVRSGDSYWYAPYASLYNSPAAPVYHEAGGPIVMVDDVLRVVRDDGTMHWSHEVYRTEDAANQAVIERCNATIAAAMNRIAECRAVLAKLRAAGEVPVCAEQLGNELTAEEMKIPF
jgi:hypothetical protein